MEQTSPTCSGAQRRSSTRFYRAFPLAACSSIDWALLINVGEVAKDLYVAFTAKSADVVRASYEAAIDTGATSIKEPSLRPEWRADYFAANIGDPDGHNIEIAYKPWLYK